MKLLSNKGIIRKKFKDFHFKKDLDERENSSGFGALGL